MRDSYMLRVDTTSIAAGSDNYKRAPRQDGKLGEHSDNGRGYRDPTFDRVNLDDSEYRRRRRQRARIIREMIVEGTLSTPNII